MVSERGRKQCSTLLQVNETNAGRLKANSRERNAYSP